MLIAHRLFHRTSRRITRCNLFVIVLTAAFFSYQPTFAQCKSDIECKGDRICVKGECVDPAPKGTSGPAEAAKVDTASQVADSPAPPVEAPAIANAAHIDSAHSDIQDACGGCKPAEICYRDKCQSKEDIASTGNVKHGFASLLYGIGTISYFVPPPLLARARRISRDEPSNAGNPIQTGNIILNNGFWALQFATLQSQKKVLADLGVTTSSSLYWSATSIQTASAFTGILSMILGWFGGYGTSDRYVFSFDNPELLTQAAVFGWVTAGLATTSYIMNMRIYAIQKRLLEDAVYKKPTASTFSRTIQISPVAGYRAKTTFVGVAAAF